MNPLEEMQKAINGIRRSYGDAETLERFEDSEHRDSARNLIGHWDEFIKFQQQGDLAQQMSTLQKVKEDCGHFIDFLQSANKSKREVESWRTTLKSPLESIQAWISCISCKESIQPYIDKLKEICPKDGGFLKYIKGESPSASFLKAVDALEKGIQTATSLDQISQQIDAFKASPAVQSYVGRHPEVSTGMQGLDVIKMIHIDSTKQEPSKGAEAVPPVPSAGHR